MERLDLGDKQLKRLYLQLHDALRVKLQKKVGDDNELTKECLVYLDTYVNNLFSMVLENSRDGKLRIQDLLADIETKHSEPFDLELNETVKDRFQEWEDETVKATKLRQEGPQKVAEIYNENKAQFLQHIDEKIGLIRSQTVSQTQNEELDHIDWNSLKSNYFKSLQNLSDASRRNAALERQKTNLENVIEFATH